MIFMGRNARTPPETRWVFQMVAWIYAALLAATVVTLLVRATSPGAGRVATMALNIVLLFFFPFGTALGVYGLMKVDKGGSPGAGPHEHPA